MLFGAELVHPQSNKILSLRNPPAKRYRNLKMPCTPPGTLAKHNLNTVILFLMTSKSGIQYYSYLSNC